MKKLLMLILCLSLVTTVLAESNANGGSNGGHNGNANGGSNGQSNGGNNGNANGGDNNGDNGNHYGQFDNGNDGNENSSDGKPVVKKLEQSNLQEMIMRMSDGKVGRLLINPNMQNLLGGNCKVQVDNYGSALYTLIVPGSETKKIGVKDIPKVNVSVSQQNIRRVSKISIPPAPAGDIIRTSDEVDVALKELGAAFKAEITDRQWPCGATPGESSQLLLSDLKDTVEFYKDEETGAIECVSPNGYATKIRSADSCTEEEVIQVLPQELCDYVLHLVRNENQDELEIALKPKEEPVSGSVSPSGGPSGGSSSGSTVISGPRSSSGPIVSFPRGRKSSHKISRKRGGFKSLSGDMKKKIRLARYLNEDPDIAAVLKHSRVPKADAVLSRETLNFISDNDDTNSDFNSLSEDQQVEITRIALSIESIRDEHDFIQPSGHLKGLIDGLRPYADAILANNPDLELSLYRFPRRSHILKKLAHRLKHISAVTGKDYKVDLACGGEDDEVTVRPGKKIRRVIERRNPRPVRLQKTNFNDSRAARLADIQERREARQAQRDASQVDRGARQTDRRSE